tara:strand:+ start:2307 stop:3566 length:1260 start_codon:yes stop_codon:yes gene_type:complete
MPKYRPKLKKSVSNKQWIQYGVVAVFIGGGLYLNFSSGRDRNNDIDTSPAELVYVPAIPVSENADDEPSDEEGITERQQGNNSASNDSEVLGEDDDVGNSPRAPAGASLDEYSLNHAEVEEVEHTPIEAEVSSDTFISGNATPLPTFDIAEERPEQAHTNSAEDLSNDIERLVQNRNRIEQRVRRGQIPPSQREEIMRSEDFNAVIAKIGRRVGEAWYYDGDDHAEHGAILGIELGSDGEASDIRIRRSSGHQPFNDSVLEAAQRSVPFVEVATLSSTAQTLLNPFSLTFGSMDAIEAYEATWERQAPIDTSNAEDMADNNIEHRAVAMIKREMRNQWPSSFTTGVDHDVSLLVTLAIPLGNVASIDFLRATNNVDVNDRIYQLVRNMPSFTLVRDLSLQEQQAVRQFNLHVTPSGTLR